MTSKEGHHHDTCGCGHDHDHHHHDTPAAVTITDHHHHDTCGCGHNHTHGHSHEEDHADGAGRIGCDAGKCKETGHILENLGCANCAAKMERQIRNLSGVKAATITYATKQLVVAADDPERLYPQIKKLYFH